MTSVVMNRAIAAASKIYLDANCIISFIERSDAFQQKIAELIRFATDQELGLACSEIGIAECLFGAFKFKSDDLAGVYHELFYDIALFELGPIDGERAIVAAQLGAEKSLKLIDALHFLCAIDMQCDVFVTNDERVHSSHGIKVVYLKDLI